MIHDVEARTVTPLQLAAVRRHLQPEEVSAAWRPALDLVWAFIRARDGLWAGGHNVFVYRRPVEPGEAMTVDFGVQVTDPFEGDGVVMPVETPAGRVATARHVGPMDRLAATYGEIEAWLRERGETAAGTSWETYGDWGDDLSTWEVEVTVLLAIP